MIEQNTVREDSTAVSRPARPVKVLFLEITLAFGGAERLLCSLVNSFDRSRVQPLIVCLGDPGPLADQVNGDTPVYHNLGSGKPGLSTLLALIRLVRKERPDIIYTCNYPVTMFSGRLAGLLTGGIRHVVALHSIGYIRRERQRCRSLKLIKSLIARFVAVSKGQKRHYVETHGINPARVEVIYGGGDIDRFSAGKYDRSAREEFGIPQDAQVVGILAVLRPEKKHEMFLQMAQKVLSSHKDVYFLIVGDGPERPRLEDLAADLGITDRVLFVGSRPDAPRMLKSFDISVLCSANVVETFPQCLVESMAMELPVVSTDVGSINEMVIEGETGYLVPEGDAGALSDRILHLLDHPDEGRAMGVVGRRRIEENFTKEIMVSRHEDMFERLTFGQGVH